MAFRNSSNQGKSLTGSLSGILDMPADVWGPSFQRFL